MRNELSRTEASLQRQRSSRGPSVQSAEVFSSLFFVTCRVFPKKAPKSHMNFCFVFNGVVKKEVL